MNDIEQKHHASGAPDKGTAGDEALESLFSRVSARQKAPDETEQAVREELHAEWLDLTRRKKRRKNFTFAIAASILLGAIISVNLLSTRQSAPGLPQVAVVSKQSGNIFVRDLSEPSSAAHRLAARDLFPGQVLSTAQNARLAIELRSGETIRLDENTRLAFISGHELELISGQIYVDSHMDGIPANPADTLLINTFAGVIQHLGTQYIASINDTAIDVKVREGRVRVASALSESVANLGQQLSVTQAGGSSLTAIEIYGQAWEWTELVTPEFTLDGRSALEFIQWVGRETGRLIVFSPDGSESLARSTELRGRIDLEPLRALDLILQTSDLEPIIENGNIRIRKKTET